MFLDLKNPHFEDYIVLTHDSCLLDKSFHHKYTHDHSTHHEDDLIGYEGDNNPELLGEFEQSGNQFNDLNNINNSKNEVSDQNEAFIQSEESKMIRKSREAKGQNFEASVPDQIDSYRSNGIQADSEDQMHYSQDYSAGESEESEDEKEGGSPEDYKRAQMLRHESYNPAYSVFNTEAKFIEEAGVINTQFNDPYVIDDYYIENIRINNTEVRDQRTGRIVPPKTINLTEQDEQRMFEMEKKLLAENKWAQNMNEDLHAIDRRVEEIDVGLTGKLDKFKLEEIKERETRAYYMENLLKKRAVLDVYAIEFDWLFGKQGSKFLRKIANSDSIELFSLEIIKIIILFFWEYYKRRIIIVALIPFLIYFGAFIAYATFIHEDEREEDKNWGEWYIASFVLQIIILVLSGYHIVLELLYFKKNKLKYFTVFFNYVNMITIGLAIATVVIDMTGTRERVFIPVASLGVLFMWLKLFFFGRIMNSTSTIVRMILEISKDMVPFLFLVIIVILGFTNGLYVIAYSTDPNEETGKVERFTDNNVLLAITYTWKNGLGDFNIDGFEDNYFTVLVYIVWFLCSFLILVVFLNLLIAVLSDSFDKIQETLENNLLKEMAIMMSENEVFVRKRKIFKDVKYLFVIKKDFMKTKDRWGGRLDYVNKIIKRKQRLHFNIMDKVVENTEETYKISLKHRLHQFQQKTDKSLNHIIDRIDRLDTNMRDYKILFEGLRKKY